MTNHETEPFEEYEQYAQPLGVMLRKGSAIAPDRWKGCNWSPLGMALMGGKWYRAYCSWYGNRQAVERVTRHINQMARAGHPPRNWTP